MDRQVICPVKLEPLIGLKKASDWCYDHPSGEPMPDDVVFRPCPEPAVDAVTPGLVFCVKHGAEMRALWSAPRQMEMNF